MKTNLGLALVLLAGMFGPMRGASPEPTLPTDFKSFDTDGDGRISLAEFTAPAEAQRARRAEEKGDSKEPSKTPGSDSILGSADTIEGRYSPEVFRQLDIDHDHYVSPLELEALIGNAHNISQP